MKRAYLAAAVALALGSGVGTARAADLFWQGGTANLSDANYTDGTNSNLTPAAADNLYIGNNGTANSAADQSVSRLFIGHNLTDPGAGTVNVTGGTITTTGGIIGNGTASAGGIVVGQDGSGTLNVSGTATVNSNRRIDVGYGDDASANATLNVGPGTTVSAVTGDMVIGTGNTGAHGIAGHYNQTGGTVTIDGRTLVGQLAADGSSFSISGGSYTCNGVLSIADNIGDGGASNVTLDVSGDATLNPGGNIFIARGATSSNVVVNLSGTATINGGNRFLMGSADSPNDAAHDIVVNQSGGTLNTVRNLSVADQNGYATYNLSGTGVINTTTGTVVGRQGTGRFFQTGGTANYNGGVFIGNAQNDTGTSASGLYEISAGALNATANSPSVALAIAAGNGADLGGTGTLHVIGGDSIITVNGDFHDGNGANGMGTLAYTLQSGESLSEIMVSGAATFDDGSTLAFDLGGVTPSQSSYDLLTATTITDNGLTFDDSAAPGWGFQIVDGGNGKILQAVSVPEPASLGLLAGAGLLALRRRRRFA